MTIDGAIISFLGTAHFAEYEQNVYEKYQEMAENEIIAKLNSLLASVVFLKILKHWAAQCGCRYLENRQLTVRLKSGRPLKIQSPVFLRAKPKRKRGRSPKRHKGALRHPGLELLGIIKRVSPALMEICVSMAVLCPSFEVAANALRGLGVAMNEHLLQSITSRFARLARSVRVECNGDAVWQKPGIKTLVCVGLDEATVRKYVREQEKIDSQQKNLFD